MTGIILAAGESRRMGYPKALLPYRGTTFLGHLMNTLRGQVDPLVVVLGAEAERIRSAVAIPDEVPVVVNEDYAQGQLSSLKVGLKANSDAALVALVDHPCIGRDLVALLVRTYYEKHPPLLIPTYRGRRGHPMIFSSALFAELMAAPLDQGARVVVRRHQALELSVEEEGILHDLDDPEKYFSVTGNRVPAT
jgi:molybdenum cofactor cytidylyltransferase